MEVFMRNRIKLFGIIAIAAVIAFSFAACGAAGDPSSPGGGGGGGGGGGSNRTLIATINVTNYSGVSNGCFGYVSTYIGPMPTTLEQLIELGGNIVGGMDNGETPPFNIYGYGTSNQTLNGKYSIQVYKMGTAHYRWWGDIQITNGNATINWAAPHLQYGNSW